MSTFDDRENAFENKFAHDAEMQFKAESRRNRLVGLWAAEKLGLQGAEADEYVRAVIRADFQEAGHEDVVRKLAEDLKDRSTAAEIRLKLAEFLSQAKAQLMSEG